MQPLQKKLKSIEENIKQLGSEQKHLEKQLADNSLYENENKDLLQEILLQKQKIDTELEDSEYLWLEVSEKIEMITESFAEDA
mgnify:FL=1